MLCGDSLRLVAIKERTATGRMLKFEMLKYGIYACTYPMRMIVAKPTGSAYKLNSLDTVEMAELGGQLPL